MADDNNPASQGRDLERALARLKASDGEVRSTGARDLARLVVHRRGSIRTRGSAARPAADSTAEHGARLTDLLASLEDPVGTVRARVARVLGHIGGDEAAAKLTALLAGERDEEVRLAFVTALRNIGGPDAVAGLCRVLESGSPLTQEAAASAVQELLSGGALADDLPAASMRVPSPAPPASGSTNTARTRGAVRVRGGVVAGRGPAATAALEGALRRIEDDPSASDHLRLQAREILAAVS